ncbi:MAG: helix-turn-helix transcriptional regulator [Burkholderiales bacterium]|nr:helix-turn-helix transcriptional regulator [Burkholderiales bacterium]
MHSTAAPVRHTAGPGGKAPAPTAPGHALRTLRQRRRISQLELSLRVGVSQRHLSCIETGRAQASREMLHALLDALEAPLAERNDTLLAAGYAPAFRQRTLADAEMAPVRDALDRLLQAHDPAPAFVLDDAWNLLQANRGTLALMGLLGLPHATVAGGLNLLRATFMPGGLAAALVNADEVCAEIWQRAQREAMLSPALRGIVDELRPQLPRRLATHAPTAGAVPLLLTWLRTAEGGELKFFSAFTTFGAPLDVTAASLRVEHFFPADEPTRVRMARAVAALPA